MNKLSQRPIRSSKVQFRKNIASFDSKANDNQSYPITIYNDKYTIRSNASIIIMPIRSFELEV